MRYFEFSSHEKNIQDSSVSEAADANDWIQTWTSSSRVEVSSWTSTNKWEKHLAVHPPTPPDPRPCFTFRASPLMLFPLGSSETVIEEMKIKSKNEAWVQTSGFTYSPEKHRNVCVNSYATAPLITSVRFSKAAEVRLNLFVFTTDVWVKKLPEIIFTFFHTGVFHQQPT